MLQNILLKIVLINRGSWEWLKLGLKTTSICLFFFFSFLKFLLINLHCFLLFFRCPLETPCAVEVPRPLFSLVLADPDGIYKGWNCRCRHPLQVAEPSGVGRTSPLGLRRGSWKGGIGGSLSGTEGRLEKANDRHPISSGHADCLLASRSDLFSCLCLEA